jgi:cation transport ATPase
MQFRLAVDQAIVFAFRHLAGLDAGIVFWGGTTRVPEMIATGPKRPADARPGSMVCRSTVTPDGAVEAAQDRPAARSKPAMARQSEATRPKQQNSAIVLIGWVSVVVSGIASIRTVEIAFTATSIIQFGVAVLVTSVGFRMLSLARENGFKGAGELFFG